MSHLWREAGSTRWIFRSVRGVREPSEGLQVHATAAWGSQAGSADERDLPRMRLADGDSSWTFWRIPRLQHISEVPRHAVDANGGEMSEGRRRHRGASLQEAREGFLRLLE